MQLNLSLLCSPHLHFNICNKAMHCYASEDEHNGLRTICSMLHVQSIPASCHEQFLQISSFSALNHTHYPIDTRRYILVNFTHKSSTKVDKNCNIGLFTRLSQPRNNLGYAISEVSYCRTGLIC